MRTHLRSGGSWLVPLALLVALSAAAPAEAARWRVSGTISGTYTNSVAWTSPCPGSFAQRTRLAIKLRRRRVSEYRPDSSGYVALMRVELGGRWSLTGSYSPNSQDPYGPNPCDPEKAVSCEGQVVADPGKFNRSRTARLVLQRVGSRMVGRFEEMTRVSEDALFRNDLDPICSGNGDSQSIYVPFYGLGGGIGTVTARTLRVSRARLRGRRAFRVTGPLQEIYKCADSSYSTCTERTTIRVRLRFSPVRRKR